MRGLIVICLFTSVVAVPEGYIQNSIDLPHLKVNPQLVSTEINTENNRVLQQTTSNTFNLQKQAPPKEQINAPHNSQQFSTAPNYYQNFGFNSYQQQQQAIAATNFAGQYQQVNGFQQQTQQYLALPPQPPAAAAGTVTKDIFVHVAPEDQHYQQHIAPPPLPPPPRKHYRIVFIKAPTQNNYKAALRLQPAPIEEKTIIYVLTKKPDPIDLQTAIQNMQTKQLSKPEVYFIKYKTQAEAQHAQRTIQEQYEKLGGSSQVSDEGIAPVTSVIGSLDGIQQPQQQPQQQQPHQQQQQLQKPKLSFNFSIGSGGHASKSLATSSSQTSSSTSKTSGINKIKYLPPIVKL